ncbi:MAG TPA: FtsH protease activity modulator HflK [Rhodanobacteraceae bacterium]|nr:FtsH protease activity modulator HflK [Rhodanobacteraceae bacterium]
MPWKEPGDKPREPRGREPWGPGQGGHGSGPDLEAWLRKLRRGLGPFGHGPLGILALIVVVVVLWFLIGGWTSIGGQQVGVVTRFGRFDAVLQPGLHLRFPSPIDRVRKVEMGHTRTLGDEARLLTRDGQLVLVDYDVQYKVSDARVFLFATRDAEEVVRHAATAAARAAVGSHTLQCLIDDLGLPCPQGQVDPDQLAGEIRAQLDAMLANPRDTLGVALAGVEVRGIGVPSDVKQAFDAIGKAHDEARTAKASAEAEVARSKVETKNQAAAIKADAEAYRQQAVAGARAAVARFAQVLVQYQAAPQVTRHRLWLDAMQDVLTKNRVVVNTGSGNVIVQFPAQHAGTPAASASTHPAPAVGLPASAASASIPVTSGPGVQGVDP